VLTSKRSRLLAAIVGVAALAVPASAAAQDMGSPNMTLLKNVAKPADGGTQSDLAFQGRYAYAGTFTGFGVIDISNPANATEVAFFKCNGAQGDISVYGGLLFMSVDTPQTGPGCDSTNAPQGAATPGQWEGVRVFDISNPKQPKFIKSVATDCGSHTHTLVPDDKRNLYIYVSSYAVTTGSVGPDCQQFHGKISVIHVPLRKPWKTRVVAEPEVDVPDFDFERLEIVSPTLQDTNGCHDITVLKPLKLAAAACLSVGQLWDIRHIKRPRLIRQFDTPEIRAWHSSTFSWDGERVVFGDEAGGGVLGRCREEDYPTTGAVWFYDTNTGAELGVYKQPRFFPAEDHCTMHNFNFVPGVERDILVSAAYHAGTTVADVTDPANPEEIAWYEANSPIVAGGPAVHASTWSSYFHNKFVYANDSDRGVDVFKVDHPALAGSDFLYRNNPQTQERLIGVEKRWWDDDKGWEFDD
jgi:LVIVD repeat